MVVRLNSKHICFAFCFVIFCRFSPFYLFFAIQRHTPQLVKTQYAGFVCYSLLLDSHSLVFLLSLHNMLVIAYEVAVV